MSPSGKSDVVKIEQNISTAESVQKSAEVVRGVHLEGVKPVYGCLIDKDSIDPLSKRAIFEVTENGENVDYFAQPKDVTEKGMRSPERYSYVISAVNEKPKFSEGFKNCTGVVIVAKDKETKKEISIMSHQDPKKFLEEWRETFILDLSQTIRGLQDRALPNTIDALVFGGKYKSMNDYDYKDSVKLLSSICKAELGFEPVVITGPNLESDETNAYFDTARRRFYLVREKQTGNASNNSFAPSEMHKEIPKWDEVSM